MYGVLHVFKTSLKGRDEALGDFGSISISLFHRQEDLHETAMSV